MTQLSDPIKATSHLPFMNFLLESLELNLCIISIATTSQIRSTILPLLKESLFQVTIWEVEVRVIHKGNTFMKAMNWLSTGKILKESWSELSSKWAPTESKDESLGCCLAKGGKAMQLGVWRIGWDGEEWPQLEMKHCQRDCGRSRQQRAAC